MEAGAEPAPTSWPDRGLSSNEVTRLFVSEQGRLARAIRRRIGDPEDAADLVQDAFMRLLQARPATALRAPQAYLQRIVRNLLHDRYQGARSRRLVFSGDLPEALEPSVPPEQDWAIEAEDLMTGYSAALAALTPRTREVFLLHRVEELRYREIAERLGITVATVEYHMARALAQLDKALDR